MKTLELLLSVFISPWQFFKESVASPSIEIQLFDSIDDENKDWQKFCLRPVSLSILETVNSIFYNATSNEAMYIFDCAERLISIPSLEDERELTQRLKSRLRVYNSKFFQFRLVFVVKVQGKLLSEVLFTSQIEELH